MTYKIIERSTILPRTPKDMPDCADEIDGLPNFDEWDLKGVVYHYTGVPGSMANSNFTTVMRQVQKNDMDTKHYSDIMYNMGVNPFGQEIAALRGLVNKGAANGNSTTNGEYLSILVFIGTTDTATDLLMEGCVQARELVLARWPKATEIKGHRDMRSTSCPGDSLYGRLDEIATWKTTHPAEPWSCPLPRPTLKEGDRNARVMDLQMQLQFWGWCTARADGVFGPVTRQAVVRAQTELRRMKIYEGHRIDGIFDTSLRNAWCRMMKSLSELGQ